MGASAVKYGNNNYDNYYQRDDIKINTNNNIMIGIIVFNFINFAL